MIGGGNKGEGWKRGLHALGGALSGGATVPYSWAVGGARAGGAAGAGALVGALCGLNDSSRKQDDAKPSGIHRWGGALSGGSTVPYSWALGGRKAAGEGVRGALIGGLFGLNDLSEDDEE